MRPSPSQHAASSVSALPPDSALTENGDSPTFGAHGLARASWSGQERANTGRRVGGGGRENCPTAKCKRMLSDKCSQCVCVCGVCVRRSVGCPQDAGWSRQQRDAGAFAQTPAPLSTQGRNYYSYSGRGRKVRKPDRLEIRGIPRSNARARERERERGIKNTKRKRNEEYSTRSNDRGEPPERVRQLPRATAAKGTVTRGTGSHGQNESCRPHPPSCSGAGACCGVCVVCLVCPQGTSSGRVHAALARLGLCYGRREASFAQFQAAPVAWGRWWGRSVGRMRMMCRKNFWVLGALQPNRAWNAELGRSPRIRRLNRTVFSVLCMYTT